MTSSPCSSGWRSASSAAGANSGASSRNSTPRWAREAAPGRGRPVPPPTSAVTVAVWCGSSNGGRAPGRRPASSVPATEWTAVTSSACSLVEVGQQAGQPRGQHRLAGARRARAGAGGARPPRRPRGRAAPRPDPPRRRGRATAVVVGRRAPGSAGSSPRRRATARLDAAVQRDDVGERSAPRPRRRRARAAPRRRSASARPRAGCPARDRGQHGGQHPAHRPRPGRRARARRGARRRADAPAATAPVAASSASGDRQVEARAAPWAARRATG